MSTARMNLFWLIMFGAMLPLSVVVATKLAGRSFERVRFQSQTIRVKGYAEKGIASDLAVWRATIAVPTDDIASGYLQLDDDRSTVKAFLAANGFETNMVTFSPVEITTNYQRNDKGQRTNEVDSYTLKQAFSLSSNDVIRIATLAQDAGSLLGEGIEIRSDRPEYLFTKLNDLKLDMLAEATSNGVDRAHRLITGSGNTLGSLRSASQGVFQITSEHSTEVSSYGINNTSSIRKTIKAVVTLEYGIE